MDMASHAANTSKCVTFSDQVKQHSYHSERAIVPNTAKNKKKSEKKKKAQEKKALTTKAMMVSESCESFTESCESFTESVCSGIGSVNNNDSCVTSSYSMEDSLSEKFFENTIILLGEALVKKNTQFNLESCAPLDSNTDDLIFTLDI